MAEIEYQRHIKMCSKNKNTGTLAKMEADNEFKTFFFLFSEIFSRLADRKRNLCEIWQKISCACVDSKTDICCHSFL